MKPVEVIEIGKEKAIQKYELTPERVKKMADEYMGLAVILEDAESYGIARKALTTCVKARTGTDARRKELTKEARQWQTDVNQAAKDLLEPLQPVELHLKAELQKEDDRKEAILEAKRQNEINRINNIQKKIEYINENLAYVDLKPSNEIAMIIDSVNAITVSPDEYQEFSQVATTAKEETLALLQTAFDNKLKQEQEDEARKLESERLEKIRLEQEAKAAELKKTEDEQAAKRKIEEEKIEAAQKKIDIEKEVFQAEKDRIEEDRRYEQEIKDREKFEAQAKEDARIQAEKDVKEKAEREEREAAERDEAEIAERERLAALQPDKDLFLNYIRDTFPLQGCWFKSQKATELFDNFQDELVNLIEALKTDIEKL